MPMNAILVQYWAKITANTGSCYKGNALLPLFPKRLIANAEIIMYIYLYN